MRIILNHFIFICLLILSGIIYFMTLTQPGLRVDIEIAKHYLPGQLQITDARGNLFSAFTLKNISYQNASQQITIQSFALAWNPFGLLKKKWIIDSITVDHANITIKNLATQSSGSTPMHFDFLQQIRIKQINLNQIMIKINDATLNLQGALEKNWNVTWQANIPDLSQLMPNTSGSLLTSGQISGPLYAPFINADIDGKKLLYANQQIDQLHARANIIVKPKVNSTLEIAASGLKINDYPVKKFNLDLSGNIENYKNEIRANINSQLTDLTWLPVFIPDIKNPQGLIKINLLVTGTLDHPVTTCNINLSNGRVNIPVLGVTLQNIQLAAQSDANNQLHFQGNFNSGKGTATLQGLFKYLEADYPVTVSMKGSDLQAIDLGEYHVVISPNITLNFAQQNLQLDGNIDIPSADIAPKNFSSTLTLPTDVVFVDAKSTTTTLPFTMGMHLNLTLGDKIHVAYNNLTTHLAGTVQLNQRPGALITAAGQLYTTKGSYTAYGQTLKIKTGHLIYTGGSLMNPGLNISAVKEIKTVDMAKNVSSYSDTTRAVYTGSTQTITAGVQVTGTLDNPLVTLFSNPTLSQSDILSYLLFGYPQSQISGHEYGALLSALSSLNSNTSTMGNIPKKMRKKLGLSELNVESTQVFNPTTNSTVSATTFVIGKQISQNLSMHYSVGLFYPVSILNLRYKLSKRWAIQSETSTIDNGADLLFSIERD